MKQLTLFAVLTLHVWLLSVAAHAQIGCSGSYISVSGSGRVLGCSAKMESYQWVYCSDFSPVTDAIGQYYYVTGDGAYSVIVTTGSCRDTLACVSVSGLGVDEQTAQKGLTLFPNPSSGKLQLQSNGFQGLVQASITDVLGRSVAQYDIIFANSSASLDLSLPAGSYHLHIRDGSGRTAVAALTIQ